MSYSNSDGRIFLLNDSDNLVSMEATPYDSERLLQELLAKYPDLLAGDQIDSEDPKRWLLVTREMQVPGDVGGSGRWSLDHLFLDQEAVPTLVEVKRSTDNRIRREVVGQMLDYAANGIAHWPIEKVRTAFESRCEAEGTEPGEELIAFLGDDHDPTDFWQLAKTNLQAGRIRLVFVADEIPPELRRIVEFLNSHLDPTEVLAIEIKQYVGQGMKTLVPRVLGMTETARIRKRGAPREGNERGPSNKDRVYIEYHRRLVSTEPSSASDLQGIARDAGATGIKINTIRNWVSDWKSPAPRGIPRYCRENPLHIAAHGDNIDSARASIRAVLAEYYPERSTPPPG